MLSYELVLLAGIVFAAFTTEATAGFGSMILSLTVAVHFMAIDELLPVLVPLNLVLSAYMVTRYHGSVARRLLLVTVLPLMLLGLGVGQLVFYSVETAELRYALGALVVAVAARELIGRRGPSTPLPRAQRGAWILGAGIIHGVFATGGPPLVYALSRSDFDKRTFRSTLATIWLVLDVALITSFVIGGKMSIESGGRSAILLPVVALAIFCGERIHHRIDEKVFRTAVFSILLVAGVTLWL